MIGPTAKSRRVCIALAVVLSLALRGGPAWAQSESLSAEVLAADTLSDAQKQEVARFANAQMQQLIGSQGPVAAVAARDALLKILDDARAKSAVKTELAKAVTAQLPQALQSPSDRTRMLALVLASRAPLADSFPHYLTGLADKTAGVRYLAAKALAQATTAPNTSLTEDQQKVLLAALTPALGKEASGPTFEQMARAFNAVKLPEATAEGLAALRNQVAVATNGFTYSHVVGVDLLLQQFEKIVAQQPAGLGDTLQRELGSVSVQYLLLVARRMAKLGSEPDPSLEIVCIDLVQTIDQKVLAGVVRQLGGGNVQGPPLYNLARQKQWGEMGLNALKWSGDGSQPGILSAAPINIPYEKLKLP